MFISSARLSTQSQPTIRKNYADSSSGASILFASNTLINKKASLDNSNESYMSLPECAHPEHHSKDFDELPYVIINLSDDIVVDSIQVSNKEDFSRSFHQIYVEASIDYPPSKWISLG